MSKEVALKLDSQACLYLSGALTFESVPEIYRRAQILFDQESSPASIDLSGVTTADSAGLALLLEWSATLTDSARNFPILNSPPSIMSLAHLCEADDLLKLSERTRQA